MKKKLSLKKFLSRRLAWGVLLLNNLFLISIGYSSWIVSAQSTLTSPIYVSVADIVKQATDFKGTASYVSGSESFFSYYVLDGKKHLTTNAASINVEINPSKAKAVLSNNVVFSILLSCIGRTAIVGSDLFANSSCIKAPVKVGFLYEQNGDCFYSNDVELSKTDTGSGRSQYNITCKATLYDVYEASLCNYFSYYSNGASLSLKALFEFEIKDEERAISILEQLSDVEFYTDLPEKQ